MLNAAGAIAVSADLKSKMIALGIPETKVKVIPNGIDPERFQPLDAKSARHQLGLPEEGAIAVSAGYLIESKGHHLLIAAVAKLLERFPKLRLYVIGDGVYRTRLEELVREKQLQERVFLMGNRRTGVKFVVQRGGRQLLISSSEGWPTPFRKRSRAARQSWPRVRENSGDYHFLRTRHVCRAQCRLDCGRT